MNLPGLTPFKALLSINKRYLPELVYGGIDGSITTFAVVSGAIGGRLDSNIIIILGIANLLADGFSMSIGNYFSNKAMRANYENVLQKRKKTDILLSKSPGEIHSYLYKKGLKNDLLNEITEMITEFKEVLLKKPEEEQQLVFKEPAKTAVATFISFNVMGFIPLLFYVLDTFLYFDFNNLFLYSCIATGLSLAIIGTLKSVFTKKSPFYGIFETLGLGGAAAVVAYFAGSFIEKLLH